SLTILIVSFLRPLISPPYSPRILLLFVCFFFFIDPDTPQPHTPARDRRQRQMCIRDRKTGSISTMNANSLKNKQ
ncbi:hypothetical protein, partial [Escherichia coli]|uniref:hypothetical protein n=1 Tax=Escherichia coli TaxID=562 RepID=UPI001BB04751